MNVEYRKSTYNGEYDLVFNGLEFKRARGLRAEFQTFLFILRKFYGKPLNTSAYRPAYDFVQDSGNVVFSMYIDDDNTEHPEVFVEQRGKSTDICRWNPDTGKAELYSSSQGKSEGKKKHE